MAFEICMREDIGPTGMLIVIFRTLSESEVVKWWSLIVMLR